MTMRGRRKPAKRELLIAVDKSNLALRLGRFDAPRMVRQTRIDFSALDVPQDVRLMLAEAFWGHFEGKPERSIHTHWFHVKTFGRFASESKCLRSIVDLNGAVLVRYVEWLNCQTRPSGSAWSKSGRAGAFSTIRKLLQWVERCKPGSVSRIEYPLNPFPWRNRDTPPRAKIPPLELRAILRACEQEIEASRRDRGEASLLKARDRTNPGTLGWLLCQIEGRFGGIAPLASELSRTGNRPIAIALKRHGGLKRVEPLLYPRAESLLPYYLAIMIHSAGNPDPIVELKSDCIQSVPLLEDRKALVWFKARANALQRRTFSASDVFEPPSLVDEVLKWSRRLRPLIAEPLKDRLFLYKGARGASALTSARAKNLVRIFCKRHSLPAFALASIRPGVLAGFYRATGDLKRTSSVANHANLSTTVRYVETPAVQSRDRSRIADLQMAFVGKLMAPVERHEIDTPTQASEVVQLGDKRLITMFGFDCKDPFAGIAPGSVRGKLCTNFMGCFTCPSAVIPADPKVLAKLVQAAEHLRGAAAALHPARWNTFYAPQLRILEDDILTRFSEKELAAARKLIAELPPLAELR